MFGINDMDSHAVPSLSLSSSLLPSPVTPPPTPLHAYSDSLELELSGASSAAVHTFQSTAAERATAQTMFERMLGDKAARKAAKTRQEKEAPMRSWLLQVRGTGIQARLLHLLCLLLAVLAAMNAASPVCGVC